MLFVIVYLVPLGFLDVASIVATLADTHWHVDLGPPGLLLIPVFVIPIIHLFVSTSRMKRAVAALPRGFPEDIP